MSDSTNAKTTPYASDGNQDEIVTSTLEPAENEPSIPRERRFGRYELLMEMARGGMATLYLARIHGPEAFERLVALKRIHEQLAGEEQFIQMFLDEARITARIHHPNVASVFDMGQADGSYFLAMEYLHGQTLSDVLRVSTHQQLGFDYNHALRIVADAAAGLHAAHELMSPEGVPLGVVHRDVSPQNLMLTYDGHVKVVDFGIAYAAERITSTATGTMKGKVTYMSPEQFLGVPVDRRADIFALGIVLWEASLLRRLFQSDSAASTMMRIRDGVVPPPRSIRPELPASVERIILKALASDPAHRYQTMAELEDDINRDLVGRDQVVSHAQLAAMMEQRFYERRKVKDEQIQVALKVQRSKPVRALGMDDSPEGQSTALQFSDLVEAKPHRRTPLWVAAVVAVVGLLVLTVLLLARGGSDHRKSTAPRAAAPPPRADAIAIRSPVSRPVAVRIAPPAVPIHVSVEISPASAQPVVLFRDRKYRGSTIVIETTRVERHEYLLISAEDYHTEQLKVDLRRDTRHRVKLRSLRRSPPMRRRVHWRTKPDNSSLLKTP